jgi:ornithine--oxo-acid transaminase
MIYHGPILKGDRNLMDQFIETEIQFGPYIYHPLPVVLTRGEGCFVWDTDGKRYLDMMSAYSAVSHGHAHPRLVKALQQQAEKLSVVSRAFYTDRLGPFLQRACELSGMDKALPMNTGVEAVETSLKTARKWAYEVKKVPADEAEVIVCRGNFHGRTITAVAMSSEPKYRKNFGPFAPGFRKVEYGNVDALEDAINPRTAAFLLEPIQGEAGIIVPPDGYLAACAEVCRRNNVLLICDEIQTGLGRTGRLLDSDYEGVKPDGVLLGKALGGGLYPVSMFLARRDLLEIFAPGDHGSTFGGNALAATVGLEALNVLVEEKLVENSAALGNYIMQGLRDLNSPLISELRGRGLLIGMVIDPARASARQVCERLMHEGVLTKETHEKVVRLAPPLIIDKQTADLALATIGNTLAQLAA